MLDNKMNADLGSYNKYYLLLQSKPFFLSFNFWVFLFGPAWFFYRKMITIGIVISVIYSIISLGFYFSPFSSLYIMPGGNGLSNLFLNFILAFFANYIYMRHIEKRASKQDLKKLTSLKYLSFGVLFIFVLLIFETGCLLLIEKNTSYQAKKMMAIASEDTPASIILFKRVIKKGYNIEEKNSAGETLAFVAARKNFLNQLKYFSEIGANLEAENSKGIRLIHASAALGHKAVVEFLINKGVDINVECANVTPLMAATYGGHLDIVKLLLENKVNINYSAKNHGYTALDIALEKGDTEIANYLITHGAKKRTEILGA